MHTIDVKPRVPYRREVFPGHDIPKTGVIEF